MIPGLQGPELGPQPQQIGPPVEVPKCIQVKTAQDLQELQAFLKQVIRAARLAWEAEKK